MKELMEKIKTAEKYIAERDIEKLSQMLGEIISSTTITDEHPFGTSVVYRTRKAPFMSNFEYLTNCMIARKFKSLIFTDPDLMDNKGFFELCCKAEEFMDYNCFSYTHLDYMERLNPDRKQWHHILKHVINDMVATRLPSLAIYFPMNELVWYAALWNDETMLEEICELTGKDVPPTIMDYGGEIITEWMWMYLEAIIKKKRFDLLDKAVQLIYGKDNYNFTDISYIWKPGLKYAEYIWLLYKRYCPELSDGEIVEKLIYSNTFSNHFYTGSAPIFPSEVDFILNQDFTTNNANCILALWLSTPIELKELCRFLGDKPVFYLNDRWIDQHPVSFERNIDNCDFIAELLRTVPNMTLSLDNHDISAYGHITFTAPRLKKLFSVKKPITTDKIYDNKIIKALVTSKSRKLDTLLGAIDFDEEKRDEFVELCVRTQNMTALNFLNTEFKKGGKPL